MLQYVCAIFRTPRKFFLFEYIALEISHKCITNKELHS